MSKLLKRGLSAYKIFLNNKLVMSILMFITGLTMAIAGFSGHGNDTKTLPIAIALIGAILSLWSFYRLGYEKHNVDDFDRASVATDDSLTQKKSARRLLITQLLESLLYVVVTAIGVALFLNEHFTNQLLNLVTGGFTIFNAILGSINLYSTRNNKTTFWKFMLILTIVEFVMGIFFILASSSVNSTGLALMGVITTIAGLIEVISSLSLRSLKDTVTDGRAILETLQHGSKKS